MYQEKKKKKKYVLGSKKKKKVCIKAEIKIMDFCEGPKKVKKKTVRRKRAFKGFQKLNSPKKKYVPGFGKKKKVCITSEKKKKSMYHSAEKKKKVCTGPNLPPPPI